MGATIARGVSTVGLAQQHGPIEAASEGKARAAVGRSLAWKRLLNDLAKAMAMTDPIAYGWYVTWSLEAEGRSESEMVPRRPNRWEPGRHGLARRPG